MLQEKRILRAVLSAYSSSQNHKKRKMLKDSCKRKKG